MPRLIRSLLSASILAALSVPALAQSTITHAPDDEKRAEANLFMTAKVIAIQPDRDRIQIRDNEGVKRTLVLDDDATLPEGRVRAGTDVILAVRDEGGSRRVVSVQRSAPATAPAAARVPLSRAEPVFIPAPSAGGLGSVAAAQTSYQSGTVGVPVGGEPARFAAPGFPAGTTVGAFNGPFVDANGQPLVDGAGQTLVDPMGRPLLDGAGRPIPATAAQGFLDASGRFVDASGQPLVDGNGRPLVDAFGRPLSVTANGRLLDGSGQALVDNRGRPLNVDANGRLLGADGRPATDVSDRAFLDATGRTLFDGNGRLFFTPGTTTTTPAARVPAGAVGSPPDATGRATSGGRPISSLDQTTSPLGSVNSAGQEPQTLTPIAPTAFNRASAVRADTTVAPQSVGATAAGAVPGTTIQSGADFTPPNLIAPDTTTATLAAPVPGTTLGALPQSPGGVGVVNARPTRTFTNADLARVSATGTSPTANAPTSVLGGFGGGMFVRSGPSGESESAPDMGTPSASPDLGGLGADASPLPVGRAVQAFEMSMARLSAMVPAVDAAFTRYREACLGPTAIETRGLHSWLGLWNGATPPIETTDECEPILAQALRLGDQVKRGVRTAEDGARRSGVLPGVRRQIRAQYGMDWVGWDQ